MKKLIVCLMSIIFLLPLNNIYAADFVAGFVGRFGASSATTDRSKIFTTDFRDFETSFSFQPGVFWGYDDFLSSAFLLDIGYNKDKYELKYTVNGGRLLENYNFNSISFGLFPRLNISFVSIGVGGGVKIPLSLKYSKEGDAYSYNKYSLDFGDIKDSFETFYIPYVKVSLDFLIKTKGKFMMSLGLYANYDFPINIDKNGLLKDISVNKESIAAFDIGFQIGAYLVNR